MNNFKIIKEFTGHSGSKIFLIDNNSKNFVLKKFNIQRNLNQLIFLKNKGFNVPNVYDYGSNFILMEYIHGLDMASYLKSHSGNLLTDFLISTLKKFSNDTKDKNYLDVYKKKLELIAYFDDLPFTKDDLILSLPKNLPQSCYHGDLTLENIINVDDTFYFIDPVTIEYDSFIFDIAKLRQDLQCKWFLRDSDINLNAKLHNIYFDVISEFPCANSNSFLILMLLRVLVKTRKNDKNYKFLMKAIKKLWK